MLEQEVVFDFLCQRGECDGPVRAATRPPPLCRGASVTASEPFAATAHRTDQGSCNPISVQTVRPQPHQSEGTTHISRNPGLATGLRSRTRTRATQAGEGTISTHADTCISEAAQVERRACVRHTPRQDSHHVPHSYGNFPPSVHQAWSVRTVPVLPQDPFPPRDQLRRRQVSCKTTCRQASETQFGDW